MVLPRILKLLWNDELLRFNRTMFYVQNDASDEEALEVTEALSELCVANLTRVSVQDTIAGPDVVPGSYGPYGGHRDLVTLWMEDADTHTHPVSAVGPDESIFLDGGEFVDPDNAAVDEAVTALITFGATKVNAPLVRLRKGKRWMLGD